MKFNAKDVYAVLMTSGAYNAKDVYRIFVKMDRVNLYGYQYSRVDRIDKFDDKIYAQGMREDELGEWSSNLGEFLASHGVDESEIDVETLDQMDKILCGSYMPQEETEHRLGKPLAEFVKELQGSSDFLNTIDDVYNHGR